VLERPYFGGQLISEDQGNVLHGISDDLHPGYVHVRRNDFNLTLQPPCFTGSSSVWCKSGLAPNKTETPVINVLSAVSRWRCAVV